MNVQTMPYARVAQRISAFWNPAERNVHHVLIGPTGSGKSHLIRFGILPLISDARVVVIDGKGGRAGNHDDVWSDFAPVPEIVSGFGTNREGSGPHGLRFRLVVTGADAREQVRQALAVILAEGHCVLVVDETRPLSDQLGAGKALEQLIYEGRSSGVTCILGAQDPAWLPPAVKSQGGVLWLARQRNRAMARTLAEWTPYGRELVPTIGRLRDREWLITDSWGAEPVVGVTMAPSRLATFHDGRRAPS